MIIYEVNLNVDAELRQDYLPWLRHHIQEMLSLPGFHDAELYQVEVEAGDRLAYCVQYRVQDREALEGYLANQADTMRADGERRFGGRFSATRRILAPL